MANEESLFLPESEDDSVFWKRVFDYTAQVYTLYTCNTKISLFIMAIQNKYCLHGEKIDDSQIMKAKIELSRVYQTLESTFSQIFELTSENHNCHTIKKFYEDQNFKTYATTLYKNSRKEINACAMSLSAVEQKSNYANIIDQRKFIERLQATAKDTLDNLSEGAKYVQTQIENVQKLADTIEPLVKQAESASKKARETADNVLPNVLTILGIFVAIIVAFVSAFFTLILADNGNISTIPQVCLIHFLLMGHVLINLIFLFMFMISRLSGKNISVSCMYSSDKENLGVCQTCNNHCPWYRRLWRKYPYLVTINWAIVLGYVILLLWWYIDIFLYPFLETFLQSHFLISVILFVVLLAICCVFLIYIPYKRIFNTKQAERD